MTRVLIVDDSLKFVREASEHFARAGWEADSAGDGEKAIEVLSSGEREFDAVVLDRALPGISGDEVIEWMGRQQHLADICVVMLTGFGGIDSAIKALKLGAFHYLSKPIKLPDLEAILRAGIAWHRAHKMRRELLKTLDVIRLLSRVVELIRDASGSDHIHVYLVQPDGVVRRMSLDGAFIDDESRGFIKRVAEGTASVFETTRETVAPLNPVFPGAGSMIAVPIMASRDRVRGALEIESETENAFSQTWVDVLRYLADLIGIGLEIGKEVEVITEVYRELRHSIATNVQIVATQAQRLQTLTLQAPGESADSIADRVRFIANNAVIIEKALQDIKAIVAETPTPRLEAVDTVELAETCLREQAEQFKELGISVAVAHAGSPVSVDTDPELVAYSLRCLLMNATESIQDHRRQRMETREEDHDIDRIVVSVEDAGAAVRIQVRDNGIGFDEEIERQLFKPLFSTKMKRLPSARNLETAGVDRVERLLTLMRQWCAHDPRIKALPPELQQGMELFIRDGDTVDLYVGHRDRGGLRLPDLDGSALCHVGTDSALTGEWSGRGEGLYSVYKYVARLGGSVSASSDGPGKGAAFTITLPKRG